MDLVGSLFAKGQACGGHDSPREIHPTWPENKAGAKLRGGPSISRRLAGESLREALPHRAINFFFSLLPLRHYRPNPVGWLCPQTATKPLSKVVAATWVSLPSRADGDRRRAWTSCKVALRRGDRATWRDVHQVPAGATPPGLPVARQGKGKGTGMMAWRGEARRQRGKFVREGQESHTMAMTFWRSLCAAGQRPHR